VAVEDQYGGVVKNVAPAEGYFRVRQVGDRWLFVTPEGNGFWMLGVFNVVYSESVNDLGTTGKKHAIEKYGGGSDWQEKWRRHTILRLKSWGFNTNAEYHHTATRGGDRLQSPNPVKMPYIHIMKPTVYGLENRWGLAKGPFKDLLAGTDPKYYTGWRGSHAADFFDPNFESYVDGWVRSDPGLMQGNIGNPWMLGIAMGETDDLFGFGPGPELPAARLHPHLGWIVLVTNYEQRGGVGVPTYPDPKVHSKYALRGFLKDKYGTIEALNASWGSSYTTFESDGGWGRGRGLLDENGRNRWVGNERDDLATATPGVRVDLDAFLYLHAKQYFTVMVNKTRQYAPQHLIFGPASLNSWGGLTRKEILRAAGESVDVVQCLISGPKALELTRRYAGNKPLVTWETFIANPDSALWRYPDRTEPPAPLAPTTQRERGIRYATKAEFLFNVMVDGVHPIAGLKWWEWTDNFAEKYNFGLVTFSGNAYDGREAVVTIGTDQWGYRTGGEERNYGDFISAVRAANLAIRERLLAEH
jgi:hypothetical protein